MVLQPLRCGEATLLERFRRGDTGALEEIYRGYVDQVIAAVACAIRRFGARAGVGQMTVSEAPDLVQEVFARAFEPLTRRRYDGVREYGPYLTHIARNVVVDHVRYQRRWVTADIEEVASEPDNDVCDIQALAVVSRYIAGLPADLRRAHEALYVRGLSQRDAAALLGLGRQVVRTLDVRLRSGLRRALEPGTPEAALAEIKGTPPPDEPAAEAHACS